MSHDVVGDGDSSTIGITSTDPAQQLVGSGGQTDAGQRVGANPDVESEMLTEQAPGDPDGGGLLATLADTTAGRQAQNVVDELGSGDAIGAVDDALGKKDEAVGRQFDDTPGGGFADADTLVSIATGTNTKGTPSDLISVTTDSARETVQDTADAAAEVTPGDDLLGVPPRVILLGIAAVVALILLRPVLQIVAGVTGS
jgi:hypothetical protein